MRTNPSLKRRSTDDVGMPSVTEFATVRVRKTCSSANPASAPRRHHALSTGLKRLVEIQDRGPGADKDNRCAGRPSRYSGSPRSTGFMATKTPMTDGDVRTVRRALSARSLRSSGVQGPQLVTPEPADFIQMILGRQAGGLGMSL